MDKVQLKSEIINNMPVVSFPFDNLKKIFGFKRVDGLTYAITKRFNPSITEEQMSMLNISEIHLEIEKWCRTESIIYQYDNKRDCYLFSAIKNII